MMKTKNKAGRMMKKTMPKPPRFDEIEFFDRLSDELQNDCVTLFNQGKSHKLAGKPKWSRNEFLGNHVELATMVELGMNSFIDLEYKFYCNGYDGRFEESMNKCTCGYVMREDACKNPKRMTIKQKNAKTR